MSKNRARLEILSGLLSFPTIIGKDWHVSSNPCIGDLVSLGFARPSKWYLSWLRGYEEERDGWPEYLLESIEDGELCWWSNVRINIYNRDLVKPSWQWDDEQFSFNDQWMEVYRENNSHFVLPRQPIFNFDDSVLMNVRIRFEPDGYQNPKTFPNWREVTVDDLDSYYKECCADYNEKLAAGQLPLPSL